MFASRMKCKEEDGIFRNCVILEECFLGDWLGCWFGVLGVKAPFYDLPIKSIFQRNFQKLKLPKNLPSKKNCNCISVHSIHSPRKKKLARNQKIAYKIQQTLQRKNEVFFIPLNLARICTV